MPLQKPKSKTKKILFVSLLMGLLGWFWLNHKNHHEVLASHTSPPKPKPAFLVTPTWPDDISAAAVGAEGYGVLASKNDDQKRPIASIAKTITALAILEKYPLKLGEDGPNIPITEQDEQIYRNYVAKNGTVVLIKAGVPLTLHQALQAMLMPSANNVADTTATWVFGSLKEYSRYANQMLQKHGITDTTVGVDASGLDPSTKSTASDLVKIGELVLKNPVLADIVSTKFAYLPVAGSITNYNGLVMRHGFNGIKPGDSVDAGNTLLFSIPENIGGKQVNVIGAILGSKGYKQSNQGAMQIVDSIKDQLINPKQMP